MLQEIITYIIIAIALCAIVLWTYNKFFRPSKGGGKCHNCSGCDSSGDDVEDQECDSQQKES